MPNFSYTNDIPFSDHNPSTDQPDMLENTNSINSIISVDHSSFNDNLGGYHKVIHQPTGSGTQNLTRSGMGAVYVNIPTNISDINQIVAGQYTPDTMGGTVDTQLFNLTSGNVISQLTGLATQASNQSDGWAWVGGILIQWGQVLTALNTGKVTYKNRFAGAIPFPNYCFNVQATLVTTGAPVLVNSTVAIKIGAMTFTKDSFEWNSNAISLYSGFFWVAIGN